MDAKQYLSQLRALKEDIRRIEARIFEKETVIQSPGTVRYDKLNVQTSPENQFENQIVQITMAKEKLLEKRVEYETMYLRIMNQIDSLKPNHRRVLKYYYVDGKRVNEICRLMHYSRDRMYHVLSDARREFAYVFELPPKEKIDRK